MKKKAKASESDDDMRAEYDFGQLKLVGRGIYSERYRDGVTFIFRDETVTDENDNDDDEVER